MKTYEITYRNSAGTFTHQIEAQSAKVAWKEFRHLAPTATIIRISVAN